MKRLHVFVAAGLALLAVLAVCGCSTRQGEGFAIYLTRDDIPPDHMPALSHFKLADEPIIATPDIVSYDSLTHGIRLTDEAFARVAALQVPVEGKSFVVCVDRQTVYRGAFWTPISSIAFDGVTIWKPLASQSDSSIKLELGYPVSSFCSGIDPRSDKRVMQALEQTGKLTTSATMASITV